MPQPTTQTTAATTENFNWAHRCGPLATLVRLDIGPDGVGTYVKHVVILFLDGFFCQRPEGYEFLCVKGDESRSRLRIRDSYAIDADSDESFRPHICVMAGGLQKITNFIGEDMTDHDLNTSIEHASALHQGSFTLRCIGRGASTEADRLSSVVYTLLIRHRDILKGLGFHTVSQPTRSGERIASYRNQSKVEIKAMECDVSFQFTFQEDWTKQDKVVWLAELGYKLGIATKDQLDTFNHVRRDAVGRYLNASALKLHEETQP